MHLKSIQKLIENFWYVPGDVLLRSIEAIVWKEYKFKHPILDIGVGEGVIDEVLFGHLESIDSAIDNDPKCINVATKNKFYKKVSVASADNLPFKDDSFVTIIANSTFEHIKNDLKAISEVSRVLKKGGVFAFTVPTNKLKLSSKINKRVSHFHYRSLDEWSQILKENGLKVIDQKYYLPPKLVSIWKIFFYVSTFKLYKRELWSYLSDKRFSRFIPKKILKFVLFKLIPALVKSGVSQNGTWVFILAKKV